MSLTAADYALIQAHQISVRQLAEAKAHENTLRLQLAAKFGADSGTHYIDLNDGWRLKGEFGTNYTVIKETLPETITAIEKAGNEGPFIAERLFRFRPELVESEYKKLTERYRQVADTGIKSSPAAPTVALVAPKAKTQ